MRKDCVDSGRAGFVPRVLLVVFGIGLLLAFGGVAKAQLSTTASITGTVTDSSGAVVPAAKVDVTNQDTKVVVSTETNGAGIYVLPSLTVGTYTVKVSKQGFKEYVENDIILHP
ncbi:MAG: carboxypeptidase-like regulatory domain-containing protein, partial [Terriglobia bacterium]